MRPIGWMPIIGWANLNDELIPGSLAAAALLAALTHLYRQPEALSTSKLMGLRFFAA
jgi:hypothetical protein